MGGFLVQAMMARHGHPLGGSLVGGRTAGGYSAAGAGSNSRLAQHASLPPDGSMVGGRTAGGYTAAGPGSNSRLAQHYSLPTPGSECLMDTGSSGIPGRESSEGLSNLKEYCGKRTQNLSGSFAIAADAASMPPRIVDSSFPGEGGGRSAPAASAGGVPLLHQDLMRIREESHEIAYSSVDGSEAASVGTMTLLGRGSNVPRQNVPIIPQASPLLAPSPQSGEASRATGGCVMVRHEGFHINPQPQPQQPDEDVTSQGAEAAVPSTAAAAPVYTDWVSGWGATDEVVGEQSATMLPQAAAAVQQVERGSGPGANLRLSTPSKVRDPGGGGTKFQCKLTDACPTPLTC